MEDITKGDLCYICAKECIIKEGGVGACKRYTRKNGELTECAPNNYLITCSISIETMPMLHYYPRGKFLQITTTGCNFDCPGCVSTVLVKEMNSDSGALKYKTSDEIISKALEEECIGIAFLMNDPLANYFTFLEVAKKAKGNGLLVGCSTNCYFSDYSANKLAPYIDFMNIGMKGFDDYVYKICGGSSIQPVLKNINTFYKQGVHIELSCMYKKGDEEKLNNLAKWVAEVDKGIPLQIMRYIPLEGAIAKWEPTIKETETECVKLRDLLDYVYLFNSPGTDSLNTYCNKCGSLLIERDFYGPMGAKVKSIHITDGKCDNCNNNISIKGISKNRVAYKEKGFEGGYPFTRALEMIEAILIASGVNKTKDVVKAWETILQNNGLHDLHHDIQHIDSYMEAVRKFAKYSDTEKNAEELYTYMKEKSEQVAIRLTDIKERPRVYYAMGKPLFCLNAERFENQLVTFAGGISVNKELALDGRPGVTISVEELNALNPDVMFISSFLSNTVEDFYEDCLNKGINVNAVRYKQIYRQPFPNSDFGSPRWILGLMNIANILYPQLFNFNIINEATEFYKRFYNLKFDADKINLSFGKPSVDWHWDAS